MHVEKTKALISFAADPRLCFCIIGIYWFSHDVAQLFVFFS